MKRAKKAVMQKKRVAKTVHRSSPTFAQQAARIIRHIVSADREVFEILAKH